MLKLLISFVLVTTLVADNPIYSDNPLPWWDTGSNANPSYSTGNLIPFPQCLSSGQKNAYSDPSSISQAFQSIMNDERDKDKYEHDQNVQKNYDDNMDYSNQNGRKNANNYRLAPKTALQVTSKLINVLACQLGDNDAQSFYKYLRKYQLPKEFCSYNDRINCHGKTSYRTPTGICNNEHRPYQGSSQTAFERFLPAHYDDYISKPRRKSVAGGPLPGCRQISLALGHKPIFDRTFNNFFTIFGQVIAHDISLSTPVSDTYSTPVSTCSCNAKYDWNKCNVIPISENDPYLAGQQCMAFPATAQAFRDQLCSLGVKEQMNGNTAALDLSILYGSTLETAMLVRAHRGKLKSTRFSWSQFESPPGQTSGKSCDDAKPEKNRYCLFGGDSRLMVTSLFTAIQTIFLRFHNFAARTFAELYPDWSSDMIYEEAKRLNIAFFQQWIYDWWLPIHFGYQAFDKYIGASEVPSYYDEKVPLVVYNEVAVAALRCHTLVRDLFSRCNYEGKRIDQLWLVDLVHKSKPAYDIENNGLDSILCGSFYDYGFASDGHFASQLQNRLFESVGQYGQYWRNDLVAINICRGREHGIAPYNAYRQFCRISKAYSFEDFGDTINSDGIELLKRLYKDPNDVDLFVGLNLEDRLPGSLLGPTSVCLLGIQFRQLRAGDRLFYTNKGQFEPKQLKRIKNYPFWCFLCLTVDIQKVPLNPYQPPNEYDNPLQYCSACKPFNLRDWKPARNSESKDFGKSDGYDKHDDYDKHSGKSDDYDKKSGDYNQPDDYDKNSGKPYN